MVHLELSGLCFGDAERLCWRAFTLLGFTIWMRTVGTGTSCWSMWWRVMRFSRISHLFQARLILFSTSAARNDLLGMNKAIRPSHPKEAICVLFAELFPTKHTISTKFSWLQLNKTGTPRRAHIIVSMPEISSKRSDCWAWSHLNLSKRSCKLRLREMKKLLTSPLPLAYWNYSEMRLFRFGPERYDVFGKISRQHGSPGYGKITSVLLWKVELRSFRLRVEVPLHNVCGAGTDGNQIKRVYNRLCKRVE